MSRHLVTNAHSGASRQKPAFVAWIRKFLGLGGTAYVSEAAFINLHPAGFVAKGEDGTKGRREVALVSNRKFGRVEIIPLSPAVPNRPVAHDRWGLRAERRKNVDWSLHANAAIQEGFNLKDTEGARVWHQGLVKLACRIAADKACGFRTRGGGDLNWRGTRPTPGSPAETFDNLDLDYVNRELLWFFWDPKYWQLARFRPVKVLPNPPGSDHRAMRVRLRRVRRK